ncbi:unnamed protein product [Lepeophtheirus salmonis]|uniref:(salmon louse) hypothetical protein n=1 Tax=Lepeophtheirus salmonis TaxID=72036 RepID=A0A7R8D988_LEPSM|nr:unnamed protein product [Lepeophtheirus salmonis]CAF3042498.1 unnamed protein product [Lepeophtheirus salmonis]
MVLCVSVFTVIAIAFERFMAVCFPIKYRSISCTESVNLRVAKHMTPVIVISVLINLPKFFETRLAEVSTGIDNKTEIDFEITELRANENYIYFYIHWGRLFGTGVIPMIVLLFLNMNIYFKIRSTKRAKASRRQGDSMALHSLDSGKVVSKAATIIVPTKRDMKMALVLSLIVILFIVCHLPR